MTFAIGGVPHSGPQQEGTADAVGDGRAAQTPGNASMEALSEFPRYQECWPITASFRTCSHHNLSLQPDYWMILPCVGCKNPAPLPPSGTIQEGYPSSRVPHRSDKVFKATSLLSCASFHPFPLPSPTHRGCF